ncbi:MAG: M20/M25/M40 family metallo-hydrolase [Phycisphaerales bacterium]
MDDILAHLKALVAADTRNPPRAITPDHPGVAHVVRALGACGCAVKVSDLGEGSVNILGTRGRATSLINCHLDTVPASDAWTRDPFSLTIEGDRAYALGACDVKGAASAVLAAAMESDAPIAILFTTDEEAGKAACVRTFLREPPAGIKRVLVCEPTGCRLGLSHPGLLSVKAEFHGRAGHSSSASPQSALHDAIRWTSALFDQFAGEGDDALRHRLNIGRIEGGTKPNVCAEAATVLLGARPATERDAADLLDGCRNALPNRPPEIEVRFRAPGLAPTSGEAFADLAIERVEALPFWTEGALFAEAGIPTAILGPGDIAQAHAADEYVELAQLGLAKARYIQFMEASR